MKIVGIIIAVVVAFIMLIIYGCLSVASKADDLAEGVAKKTTKTKKKRDKQLTKIFVGVIIACLIVAAVTIGTLTRARGTEDALAESTTLNNTVAPTESIPETEPTESTTAPVATTIPTIEETIPATTEPTDIETTIAEQTRYFDVPLSEDLQNHIFEVCEINEVDPELIVAMIWMESTYQPEIMGDGGDSYGLMQIQPRWNWERMERLGLTAAEDLLDPYNNVTVGVDIVAEYMRTGKSIEWVLMAYNGGPDYANNNTANGVVSSYARTVLSKANDLERG